MSDIHVHYIATKDRVVNTLKKYCAEQGIELIPYEHHLSSELHYLLIIEPIEIGTELFALSTIWKPWLMEKRPDVKLFFAGYSQSSHANYLNLLELPKSLKEQFEKGYAVSAYPLQKAEIKEREDTDQNKYEDPWRRFLPLTGRDMKKQMQKFVDGHDPGHSFDARVSRLRKALVDIRFLRGQNPENAAAKAAIEDELPRLREEAEKEWEQLFVRWNFYKKYFDWMPFEETTKEINEIMEELKTIMSNPAQSEEKTYPQPELVDKLEKLVHYGLDRYANFEKNW